MSQQLKNIYSGVGLHATNLLKGLANKGHSITMIVPESQAINSPSPINFITVKDSKYIQSQVRWIYYSIKFSKALKELEKTTAFDIVHFTDVRDSFYCSTNSNVIGNINDTYCSDVKGLNYYKKYYFDWLKRWSYYRLVHEIEKRKLPLLDGIIANSKYTLENISNTYSIQSSKLYLCYKSVDLHRYRKIALQNLSKTVSASNPQILFVGGNMQRKGIMDLIKAITLVRNSFPGLKVIIAGKDKFIPNYKKICESLGIASFFKFLGWVSQEDLLSLYKTSTMFIMPSLTEALGVVFLEAMAAGIPVIGTNIGGIPEIIDHESNGLLVPINSPIDLAKAISKMITDTKLYSSMAVNGIETAKRFSVEQMMRCTEKIYNHFV
ncbi:MAG TPA: glycosyltransferase family 4 protein [Brevefilum fermentans]|nr:glycosyltransferase family 4 protein [Brevefilum fermentans]HQA28498.1 glycosyltransferase family 4 protein [Brevefilum fermentans]